jgi:hypothetical protein
MRMYSSRFPGMRTFGISCAAIAAIVLGLRASAQDQRPQLERARRAAGHVELQIKVVVVPAIPPHHHRQRDRDDASISYNLSSYEENLSITEEVRSMLIDDGVASRPEKVRITTVVVK